LKRLDSDCHSTNLKIKLEFVKIFKHHEIGEKLGISEGTSKSQYSRARKMLMEKINAEELTNISNERAV